ncbi:MAG: hypothetical protein WCO82_01940 [Sphingomonadales bacterium]|jgi:hypothetical protein
MAGRFHAGLVAGAMAAPLLLAGCASFDGQPPAVVQPVTARQIVAKYPVDTVLAEFYGTSVPADKKAYRDKIIGIYMMAIDAEFLEFRRHLSRQAKSSNFGLDLGVLALSGGASFAGERTANILSAGAAGLTGVRGSISKQLFFEQALPAMLGNIDAQRTLVRAQIIQRMQQDADAYPLPIAISDLTRYEEAGSVDKAVQKAAADAGENQKAADQTLALTINAMVPLPTPAQAKEWADLNEALIALNQQGRLDLAAANAIAAAVGVAPGTDVLAVTGEVKASYIGLQDAEARKAFMDKVNAAFNALPAKPAQ